MVQPLKIRPEWYGDPVIVAASGPSLTSDVVNRCRFARWRDQWRVLCVNDAYRLMPWADALYAADASWWRAHKGAPVFYGQRYGCAALLASDSHTFPNEFPNVRLVASDSGADFSTDTDHINLGEPEHSGFQAINLALLLGAERIVLVGCDYRLTDGKAHFFGDHPAGLRQGGDEWYRDLVKAFARVSAPVLIVNATPESRLTKFPAVKLEDALFGDYGLPRHRAKSHAAAD